MVKTYDMKEHRKTHISCGQLKEKREGLKGTGPMNFFQIYKKISPCTSLDGVNRVRERLGVLH